MINYAFIDENGYCVSVSCLNSELTQDDAIEIQEYDLAFINRKYDINTSSWTDEYFIEVQEDKPLIEKEDANTVLLQQQLTDLELQNLEGMIEHQVLTEKIDTLEALVRELLGKLQ